MTEKHERLLPRGPEGGGTRAATRAQLEPAREPKKSQDMKVTLLGDFLFPTSEPQRLRPLQHHARQSPRVKRGTCGATVADTAADYFTRSRPAAIARGAKLAVGIPVRQGLLARQFRADRVQQGQVLDAAAQVRIGRIFVADLVVLLRGEIREYFLRHSDAAFAIFDAAS